jgi:ribulose-5-phosphate 4-epimerase/fuculose-1-phosphate aldolase
VHHRSRPQGTETFWVNRFGMHFSMIRSSDLIRVDRSRGRVIEGDHLRQQGSRLESTAYFPPARTSSRRAHPRLYGRCRPWE